MKPAIVMQTDFLKDISTCTMEGVCMSVDPELRIFDSSHNIPNFNTYVASTSLSYVINYWPKGTVFISVVDPGVGTSRKGCVAKLKNGCYVVTPDNGTLTHVKKYVGIEEIREIDETVNRLPGSEKVNIFHGRDVFAYTAARLASGKITYSEVGPAYSVDEVIEHQMIEPSVENGEITAMIEAADTHFGLVCSNVPYKLFEKEGISYGDLIDVTIKNNNTVILNEKVYYQPSFGYVSKGELLLMISETQQIQIAINEDNISLKYGLQSGPDWKISFKKQ